MKEFEAYIWALMRKNSRRRKKQTMIFPHFRWLWMKDESLLDVYFADQPAQLANKDETPSQKWVNVKTTLSDIDTCQLHYVRVPEKHIVIDFDLKAQWGDQS